MKRLPNRHELLKPILRAIEDLGGSASVDEIRERVIQTLGIPDELANIQHVERRLQSGGRSELEYELAWARTALRQLGYVVNSERGVWAIVHNRGKDLDEILDSNLSSIPEEAVMPERDESWKSRIAGILVDRLKPDAFERLIQRMLRETGFAQVEVTGRTGDGGIDGKGIATINGILSFHVVFQCKRYKGAVSASLIRDFRGAMVGRADKGLFITTGYFTREAIKEATRDGAVAIDLVDGERLAEKLKELRLGVRVETTESVTVEPPWFDTL